MGPQCPLHAATWTVQDVRLGSHQHNQHQLLDAIHPTASRTISLSLLQRSSCIRFSPQAVSAFHCAPMGAKFLHFLLMLTDLIAFSHASTPLKRCPTLCSCFHSRQPQQQALAGLFLLSLGAACRGSTRENLEFQATPSWRLMGDSCMAGSLLPHLPVAPLSTFNRRLVGDSCMTGGSANHCLLPHPQVALLPLARNLVGDE